LLAAHGAAALISRDPRRFSIEKKAVLSLQRSPASDPEPTTNVALSAWRTVAFFVKLTVTMALLAILLTRTPVTEISVKLRAMAPVTLGMAVALLFAVSLTTTVRWGLILRHFGPKVAWGGLWRYTLIGGFFNQVLPSGVGGDLFRIWYARKSNVSLRDAIGTVLVDRMLGLVALTAIAIVGAPFVLSRSGAQPLLTAPLAAIAIVLGASGAFLSLDRVEGRVASLLRRSSIGTVSASVYRVMAAGAWAARNSRQMLVAWPDGAIALSISLVNQLLVGYVAFLLLAGMGSNVALGWVLVLFPAVLLLSMLPISLGGWGVRESAMVVAFGLVGVPAQAALSASILYGLCLMAASLPGGVVWLTERRRGNVRGRNHT
jgi:uncharacterized protein (TIRG00374 family)